MISNRKTINRLGWTQDPSKSKATAGPGTTDGRNADRTRNDRWSYRDSKALLFLQQKRISQLSLTFKEIIFNYRKQPHCKPQVFRAVFVDDRSSRCNGPLLVELAPAVAKTTSQVSEINNHDEGQCPGSPKVSLFPSLPDMSPKKVSAVHNVYVSPLRSTKMDALISHGSKSYYACVGESTHAYQSPSKDLKL